MHKLYFISTSITREQLKHNLRFLTRKPTPTGQQENTIYPNKKNSPLNILFFVSRIFSRRNLSINRVFPLKTCSILPVCLSVCLALPCRILLPTLVHSTFTSGIQKTILTDVNCLSQPQHNHRHVAVILVYVFGDPICQ